MEALYPILIFLVGLGAGIGLALWLGRGRLGQLKDSLNKSEQEVDELRKEVRELENFKAGAEVEKKAAVEKLALLDEAREKLTEAFKSLSAEALQGNNRAFLDLAKENLGKFQERAKGDLKQREKAVEDLVKPMRESLEKVDEKIQEMEKTRAGAYSGLTAQVENLLKTQTSLKEETSNLVQALRTPNVRGQWGEVQLERVVEFAGMVDHCDFVQQESANTGEGTRQRPDLIVRLPNGRQIVVDAKTPLIAYLDALKTDDPDERKAHLKTHARHVRNHITQLGAKSYWKQFEPTPEFVVLFLPGEAFFSAALEQDPGLIEFGAKEKVIPATPTTLIALLKAVAYGWQQEKVAEHAKKVSDLGRELYERIGVLAGHFSDLGKHLDKSVEIFNKAVRSTETRLLVTARKLNEFTPGDAKEIPTPQPVERIASRAQAEELTQAESDSE